MNIISCAALICSVLAFPASAPAQPVDNWNKVDTVTVGDFDDLNPSVVHNAYFSSPTGSFLWVVFERHTSTQSQIAASKFNRTEGRWDSDVVVLSSLPPGEEQKYPDYSEVSYYDTIAGLRALRLAAWQTKIDNRWQIYYSTFNDGASAWSPPAVLVSDSLDDTGVQVRPYVDTAFIITWKRANTVMCLLKSIATITQPETLAVSSSDSMEYDISSSDGTAGVIWTSNVEGKMTPLYRWINPSSQIQFSTPETLQVSLSCSAPHLMTSQAANPSFFFDTRNAGRLDVIYVLAQMYPPASLSGDSLSDNRNARSFSFLHVTKQAESARSAIPSVLGFVVYEKYRGGDSSLVMIYGARGDTIRTPGHNWNALVSSQTFSHYGEYVLVVWESNRSGRGHIYSRLTPLFLVGMYGDLPHPASFELLQNYPNPFNPTTTIRYALPERSFVTLVVYNTLGQKVSILAQQTQEPGYHEVKFAGSGLASGVYFYRMEAAGFVQTKKLLLLY